MILNPGQLNKRVDILKKQQVEVDGWDNVEETAIYSRIAAYIRPMRGQERVEAAANENIGNLVITIRYRKGIDESCKARYDGRLFEITSIVDPNMDHESLELYCIEKKRSENE